MRVCTALPYPKEPRSCETRRHFYQDGTEDRARPQANQGERRYPSQKEIKKIEDRISKRSLVDKEVRDFTRAFFSGITEVKTDSQGRILLSRSLLEYAEITEEVYLVGTGFYLEIWSSKNWLIESKKLQALRKELIRLIGEDEK